MADTKIIITAEDRTAAAFKSVSSGLGLLESNLAKISGPLAALASAAGFAGLIKSQIDLGDELNKTSQKIGVSVESLSAYQYAAKLSDVSNEELQGGLTKLAKAMQDAAINKGGEAALTFQALGIKVTDANGKLRSTSDTFEALSKRFENAADGSNKTALAVQLLGKSGANLIPMMNQLHDLTDEAQRTGNVVSADFAAKAEQFKDSMSRMELAAGNFARKVATEVLPGLTGLIETINVAIGAQDKVSLQTLESELAKLQSRMIDINEQKKHAIVLGNFYQTGLGKEYTYTVFRIDQLENEIQLEKNLQQAKQARISGAKQDLPAPISMANMDAFDRLIQNVKNESEKAQLQMTGDESAQAEARIQIAKNEWLFKADALKLGGEQQKQFRMALANWEQAQEEQRGLQDLERENKEFGALLKQADQLRASLDEKFAIQLDYNTKIRQLDNLWDEAIIQDREAYNAMKERIELEHQAKLGDLHAQGVLQRMQFDQMTSMQQAEFLTNFLTSATASAATHNKKMFKLNQIFGEAQVGVSTAIGVMKAWEMGPFLGPVLAAVVAAAGIAQLQQIRSAQFGGGTSAPSIGGGNAIPVTNVPSASALSPAPSQSGPQGQVTIQIMGHVFAGDQAQVDWLLKQISDAVNNRNVVIIGQNSRQARDLQNFQA